MRKGKFLKWLIIIVVVFAILLGFRYLRQRRLASLVDPFEGLTEGKAIIGGISRSIGASGEINAGKRDLLYIPYAVKLIETKARPGTQVLKGGLIARYESTGLSEEISSVQADLGKVQQTAARATQGTIDMSMLSSLGLSSNDTKDAAQLESSYKKLVDAQGRLTYKAPFDGILAVLHGTAGQELASSSASNPLIEVISADSWFVLAPVSEFDIDQVKLDMAVGVKIPALDDLQMSGKVAGVIVDPVKSGNMVSYMVRVEIKGSSYRLKPGMSADIEINAYEKAGVLVIPHGFAYEKDGGFKIIALGDDGKPIVKDIMLGEEGDFTVEVIEGLKEGDVIYQDTTPDDNAAQSSRGLFNFRARVTGGR